MNQRQLRVGEAIRHALAAVLQRGDVPWPRHYLESGDLPFITISEVKTSPDLKNAMVFCSTLNNERTKETIRAMKEIVGYFRHEVAQSVSLRYVPMLRFMYDESFEYANKIDRILHDPAVAKDLQPKGDELIQKDD